MSLSFKRTSSSDLDFRMLVKLLDEDLRIRDGNDHAFYAQYNGIEDIKDIIVCYKDHEPVGCGAFKFFENGTVEIKRMFVMDAQRGAGIGLLILQQLEEAAKSNGFSRCILETGLKQPEAIRLYEKAGYSRIENYGQYAGILNSVCMDKKLL